MNGDETKSAQTSQLLNLPHFWDDKQHIRDIPKLSKAYIESLPYRSGLFTSRIVIVGEAPGREEELTKVPFVGASGKLLRRYIHNAYITNVLKVRPENNDFAKFLKENPDEVRKHILTLAAELRYTHANVYVAVGETALNVLCGKSGITKWHGSILEATMPTIKGRKVIPLIHPAAVLRNWKDYFPLFFIDCQRILSDSEFPELRIPERKYIIRPSLNQVVEFLAGLIEDNSDDESEKVIAFDLETRNHLIASIQFCNNPYEAISIPFVLSNGSSYWPLQEEIIIWRMIQQLLYTKKLIGQNIMSFDIPVLFAHGFNPFKIYENVVFDTMLAMRCYEPQLPAGLDFLTVAYTREPYYKDEGKEWKNENEDQFWIYGCKDVLVLQEIYPQLKKDLIDDKKLDFYYEWYHKLAKYQLQMTVRGMKVDLEKRRDLERQYAQDIVINQAKLIIITGENINVNSSLQMKRLLYETMKLPKVIKHERVTADRDAILKLSVKHKSEIFDYIMKVRELRKLYSTNIKAPSTPMVDTVRCSASPKPAVSRPQNGLWEPAATLKT